MHMHPTLTSGSIEQDRERAMTKRALERAAREGGQQRPGLDRAASAASSGAFADRRPTIHFRPAGPAGMSD